MTLYSWVSSTYSPFSHFVSSSSEIFHICFHCFPFFKIVIWIILNNIIQSGKSLFCSSFLSSKIAIGCLIFYSSFNTNLEFINMFFIYCSEIVICFHNKTSFSFGNPLFTGIRIFDRSWWFQPSFLHDSLFGRINGKRIWAIIKLLILHSDSSNAVTSIIGIKGSQLFVCWTTTHQLRSIRFFKDTRSSIWCSLSS